MNEKTVLIELSLKELQALTNGLEATLAKPHSAEEATWLMKLHVKLCNNYPLLGDSVNIYEKLFT